MKRPEATEYAEYYANYISKVPGSDVLSVLESQRLQMLQLFAFARADQTPLPGFEQDDYVRSGAFGRRTLADLAEEFGAVRSASISLFRSFKEDVWVRRGKANEKEVTVGALAFITAGHQMHHRIILEERYFPAIPRA